MFKNKYFNVPQNIRDQRRVVSSQRDGNLTRLQVGRRRSEIKQAVVEEEMGWREACESEVAVLVFRVGVVVDVLTVVAG